MDLESLVRAERRRIEESFRALERSRDGGAIIAFVEELTAYLASRQRVLVPAVERTLDCPASSNMAAKRTRMRVLLLRMGATYKLGVSRFDATIDELRPVVVEYLAFEEECVAPALTRALTQEEAEALAHAVRAEHDAISASFRRIIDQKTAIVARAS